MIDDTIIEFTVLPSDHKISQAVKDIIEKFDELSFIKEHGGILVVTNNKKKIKPEILEVGGAKAVVISKIPTKFQDIIEEFSGKYYEYVIEIVQDAFDETTDEQRLDFNQLKALIYFELRKIYVDGRIGAVRHNDWIRILHGLGKGFDRLDTSCKDILADNFTWESILGSYYDTLEDESE